MISKEQAIRLMETIRARTPLVGRDTCALDDVEKTIFQCVGEQQTPITWLDDHEDRLNKAEQNIATVNNNQVVMREGISHDFNIVYERLAKIVENQDRLIRATDQQDRWLHALEKSIMEMKGAQLGRQAWHDAGAEMARYSDLIKGKE